MRWASAACEGHGTLLVATDQGPVEEGEGREAATLLGLEGPQVVQDPQLGEHVATALGAGQRQVVEPAVAVAVPLRRAHQRLSHQGGRDRAVVAAGLGRRQGLVGGGTGQVQRPAGPVGRGLRRQHLGPVGRHRVVHARPVDRCERLVEASRLVLDPGQSPRQHRGDPPVRVGRGLGRLEQTGPVAAAQHGLGALGLGCGGHVVESASTRHRQPKGPVRRVPRSGLADPVGGWCDLPPAISGDRAPRPFGKPSGRPM